MSAPPPPSYNESMQGQHAYQPSYGTVGGMPPPQPAQYGYSAGPYPPQGGAYPPQGGAYPAQGGAYPPQYAPVGQGGQYKGYSTPPSYQTHTNQSVIVQPAGQSVVLVGGCPACQGGVLEDDFTCVGVLCAILFFPLGILCCLAMRQRRCANCGSVFG